MKLGMFSRLFLSFFSVSVVILNLSLFFSYFLTEKFFIENTKNNILSQLDTIKTFISINNQDVFSLPIGQVEKLNSLGLYFNIVKTNNFVPTKFVIQDDKLFLQTYFDGFTIVIGKPLTDLYQIKQNFVKIAIYVNIFSFILIFALSYLLTRFTLKPLNEIIVFLGNYRLGENNILLKNNYKNDEIGQLVDAVNKFITKVNEIYSSQKDFIQDVSHELKTPLMQIQTSIDILEEKIKDKKQLEKLETIKYSISYLSNLISKLNFMLQNNLQISYENVDLCDFMQKLVKNYEELAKNYNVEIILEKCENTIVKANSYYLEMLFGNLIKNAIVYNKKNGKVFIRIFKNKVEIEDTGIGIDKENFDKIFQRFYRNQDSASMYKMGTGLGLSIVKKIVNTFGWKIKLESEKGKGTKIVIQI